MKTFHFYLLVSVVLLLSSCKLVDDITPLKNAYVETEAQDLYNQPYGSDELQKYDIHLPAKRSYNNTKVIILFHGGSWKELDKGFMRNYVNLIKSKGDNWVIVNANYRLTFQNGIKYDQQIEDINSIIAHVLTLRKENNFSDDIYLLGFSAGGHLALSYAYSVDKGKYITGVSAIAAPADLSSEKIRQGSFGRDIEKLIGKSYNDAPDEYRRASPYYQATKSAPPTILFYGGKDNFIPTDQGELLLQKLKEKKVKQDYYFYPNETHDWSILDETITKTLLFFGDEIVSSKI